VLKETVRQRAENPEQTSTISQSHVSAWCSAPPPHVATPQTTRSGEKRLNEVMEGRSLQGWWTGTNLSHHSELPELCRMQGSERVMAWPEGDGVARG